MNPQEKIKHLNNRQAELDKLFNAPEDSDRYFTTTGYDNSNIAVVYDMEKSDVYTMEKTPAYTHAPQTLHSVLQHTFTKNGIDITEAVQNDSTPLVELLEGQTNLLVMLGEFTNNKFYLRYLKEIQNTFKLDNVLLYENLNLAHLGLIHVDKLVAQIVRKYAPDAWAGSDYNEESLLARLIVE